MNCKEKQAAIGVSRRLLIRDHIAITSRFSANFSLYSGRSQEREASNFLVLVLRRFHRPFSFLNDFGAN